MKSAFAATWQLLLTCSAALLSGCQPQQVTPTVLAVSLSWQQQAISCDTPVKLQQQAWRLQHFGLYLTDFSLDQQPLTLASTPWQQPGVVLLGSDCSGNTNWQIVFDQPLTAGQLSFTLGMPFALNHQNPLTASAPLNNSDMFWNWQLGYKFLRLDLQGPEHGWAFHLGSTGCQSASVLRPPTSPCQAANTVVITLDYLPGQHLQLDLAALLDQVALNRHSSCMSDSQQQSCQQLLHNVTQPEIWSVLP
ncbi:MbnP family copper-binding protein [Arsukibacterium sp.]|uniref:MbnP family copper-binding protein n=1 Tax=Arsukibacterium sp. TaxID=1977258 RepID=UPI002FD8AC48